MIALTCAPASLRDFGQAVNITCHWDDGLQDAVLAGMEASARHGPLGRAADALGQAVFDSAVALSLPNIVCLRTRNGQCESMLLLSVGLTHLWGDPDVDFEFCGRRLLPDGTPEEHLEGIAPPTLGLQIARRRSSGEWVPVQPRKVNREGRAKVERAEQRLVGLHRETAFFLDDAG